MMSYLKIAGVNQMVESRIIELGSHAYILGHVFEIQTNCVKFISIKSEFQHFYYCSEIDVYIGVYFLPITQ